MADTVINAPAGTRSDDLGAVAWMVAIVVVVALLIGGFFLLRNVTPAAGQTQAPGVNVTSPGGGGSTGGTGATGY